MMVAAVLVIAELFCIAVILVKGLNLTEGQMFVQFWPLWSVVIALNVLALVILMRF